MGEWLYGLWQTYNTLVFLLLTHAMLGLSIFVTLNAGLLSIGNAAFMGIGAYTAALLTMRLDAPFPVALAAGSAAAALVGLVVGLPALRLAGVYLALATLGFGEVVRVILLNLDITGGALGLNGIPPKTALWHLLLALGGLVYFFERLRRSRLGRTFAAIREDEVAARVMGIDVVYYKNLAFVIGAAIAGLAGGFNAHFTFFLSPREFGFGQAVDILAFAVLGGTGSYLGPILGSAVLTLLPELLRVLADFRMMVNGLVLLLVIVYLPNGLLELPARLRRRAGAGSGPGAAEGQSPPAPAGAAVAPGRAATPPAPGARRARPDGLDRPVLEVRGLTVRFGGLTAVAGLDLAVREGEILGLIGPNGAGKTTVFNVISGLELPTAGEIRFRGEPISGVAPHRITSLGIGRTFQNIRLFGALSVLDNVLIGEHVRTSGGLADLLVLVGRERRRERAAAARARELLVSVGLGHRGPEPAGSLPFGEQRRLELARALATGPSLLLLDEPAAGANAAERAALMAHIRAVRDRGVTILLIEHDMKVVMETCDRIAVLDFGRRIALGRPEEVARDPAVVEAYLGADSEEAGRAPARAAQPQAESLSRGGGGSAGSAGEAGGAA